MRPRGGRSGRVLALSLLLCDILSPAASFAYASSAAQILSGELDTIETSVAAHFSGRPKLALSEVETRLDGVDSALVTKVAPHEADALRPRAQRARLLLAQARPFSASAAAGFKAAPAALVYGQAQALGGAGSTPSAIKLGVAQDPEAAAKVFDNNQQSARGAVLAAGGLGAGKGAAGKAKPRLRSDLKTLVPALTPSSPSAPKPQDGAPVAVSKRVVRAGSAYRAGVADLLRASDPAARASLSREITAEFLGALGQKDPAKVRAFSDFLRDILEYKSADAAAAYLSAEGAGRVSLVFERKDGGKKILSGEFLASTAREGRPSKPAFVLMGPVSVSKDGAAQQPHLGYWREYTGEERVEWQSAQRKEEKGWGPWKRQDQVAEVSLSGSVWDGSGWKAKSKDPVKTVTTKEGQSWFGRAGDKIMKTPVLGHTLKFCDDVAATLYTGIVAAPSVFIGAATGSDALSLEAAGSYAKNPLMNKLVGEQGHLDRLTPGAKAKLDAKVREERVKALDSQLFPVSPELKKAAAAAPVDSKEAFSVLKDNYGAGSYGKRLIAEGYEREGWQRNALIGAGVLTGVAETLGEGVCNPIFWATLGAGEAVAAAKGTQAFAAGAFGAKAAFGAAKTAQAVSQAAWWGPWLLTVADNGGKVVELTAQGKFDKAYWDKVGTAGADGLFLFVVP